MNKIKFVLGVCFVLSSQVMAVSKEEKKTAPNQIDPPCRTDPACRTDPDLVKGVEKALAAVKSESPDVHEQALHVWKKFAPRPKSPHYTYIFWGIRLILWLQEDGGIDFEAGISDDKVRNVFNILWCKGLISKPAVDVLTFHCWAHLLSLHGLPPPKRHLEKTRPEIDLVAPGSGKSKSRVRTV